MPRTLAQNAQYIAETIKPAIKSAIEAQGVTVPSTDSFLDYADRIGEIEGGGSGYQLKDLPTGSISTVNDAAELPLNALKVSVEAWQEGSGDPSPSNIRPIHGWDSGEIVITNDNLIPTGTDTSKGYVADSFLLNNGSVINSEDTYISEYFPIKPNITLYVSQKMASMNIAAVCFYDKNKIYISGNAFSRRTNFEISVPSNAFYCRCTQPKDVTQLAQVALKDTDIVAHQGTTTFQQFPQTIYGAEWDVVGGELKQTDGYIASYNGESLPSTWISDRDVYASGTTPTIGAEVVYKLATPTTIDLSPLSIRLLEGTNNLYADCGEVIEGEYFVDEGAIDVRKVDYTIGNNTALKISDGRILQGFVNMNNYGIFPRDASNNWLDVDWSKDFEIGVAFKFTALPTSNYAMLFGAGTSGGTNYRNTPRLYFDASSQKLSLNVFTASGDLTPTIDYTLSANTWYHVILKFTASTLAVEVKISTDFSAYTTIYSATASAVPIHNTAMLIFGGDANGSNFSSNNLLIDTFNTYIKGDGVNWGASTGAFPS